MNRLAPALALALVALPACSPRKKAPEPPASVLRWAGGEAVALVQEKTRVIARAVDSGRTRVIWTGKASRVLLDRVLDLVWIEAGSALVVVDLRDPGAAPIPIVEGLEEIAWLGVARESDAGYLTSLPAPQGCDGDTDVRLDWSAAPQLRMLSPATAGAWRAPEGASLLGARWLSEQVGRPAGPPVSELELATATLRPAPLPEGELHCEGTPYCGQGLPFDRSGLLLVVTAYSYGDCHHYGCRLHDPATGKATTPPAAHVWSYPPGVADGPCGPYFFDRSGVRFLAATRLCAAGGACQELGGEAIGWISGGGTDVEPRE